MRVGFMTSLIAQNTLANNRRKLSKNIGHLASGERLASASEGASDLAISEKMRVRLRALNQDIQNTKNGSNLLSTAEEALELNHDLLTRMRELAVASANGIYTDADRKTMDREFQQCKDQIDLIASETNFNGIPLLDGTWGKSGTMSAPDTGAVIEEPTGAASTIVSGGTVTITGDGIYTIPAGFTGTIEVKAANVLINQADPARLTDVAIVCDPGTNLTVEDLNIRNLADLSVIDFRGADNTLNLKGNNQLSIRSNVLTGMDQTKATVHAGRGTELTVCSQTEGELVIDSNATWGGGALIGGSAEEDCGKVTVTSGNLKLHPTGNGPGIGGGGTTSSAPSSPAHKAGNCGEILISGGNVYVESASCLGAGIGNGGQVVTFLGIPGNPSQDYTTGGKITISGGTVFSSVWSDGAAIGGSRADEGIEINITGGDVHAITTGLGAAIGGGLGGRNGTVNISGGHVVAENNDLAAAFASAIGTGAHGWNYTTNITGGDVTNNTVQQGNGNAGSADAANADQTAIDDGLHIQTGTRSNQYINVTIDDMHCKSLGLASGNVLTRETADALLGDPKGALDWAIEKVLAHTTKLGAISARLEHTENILTIDAENVTSAESVIRDANMAKEMVAYTKNNILSQAAQSMLAQANQNAGSVIALLG